MLEFKILQLELAHVKISDFDVSGVGSLFQFNLIDFQPEILCFFIPDQE